MFPKLNMKYYVPNTFFSCNPWGEIKMYKEVKRVEDLSNKP